MQPLMVVQVFHRFAYLKSNRYCLGFILGAISINVSPEICGVNSLGDDVVKAGIAASIEKSRNARQTQGIDFSFDLESLSNRFEAIR